MKEKIILALGDQSLAELIIKKLDQSGYITFNVKTGEEALEKMKEVKPDLLLLGMSVLGKNSYDVLDEKSLDKDITKIPVIIISNTGIPIEIKRIPSVPCIKDYIIKTHIEPDEVLEKIKSALASQSQNPDNAPKVQNRGMGKKILWVEDDKLLSTILSKKIESTGFTLLKAVDGVGAFKILESEIPDIIILDIMLPEMNGFDILQKIKTIDTLRKVPVIMLSNMSKQSDIEKAKLLGANRFIVKAAVSLDEIIREVELLINK